MKVKIDDLENIVYYDLVWPLYRYGIILASCIGVIVESGFISGILTGLMVWGAFYLIFGKGKMGFKSEESKTITINTTPILKTTNINGFPLIDEYDIKVTEGIITTNISVTLGKKNKGIMGIFNVFGIGGIEHYSFSFRSEKDAENFIKDMTKFCESIMIKNKK